MSKQNSETGVYQLDNGYWAYRFIIKVNGENKIQRRSKGLDGLPFKTQKQAARARSKAIEQEQINALIPPKKEVKRKTVQEVFREYCEYGRSGKAYSTIRKQDSLWENHLKEKFGKRYLDEITIADISDYLEELYYVEDRAYSYVESFLKMFYLIYGQAYSRNYISTELYHKMCVNKDTKIHMPKMKIDEDTDIVYFTKREMKVLDEYFKGTNAETAFMLGKYCGLRINECYGLKWDNIDLEQGIITIDRQMYYHNGVIKLMPVKTRAAKRKIYMCDKLIQYFEELVQQQEIYKEEYKLQREQKQLLLADVDGERISSVDLVNALPNGKIQSVNSMKYHTRLIKEKHNITFKYHYLRHTYGTRLAELNTPTHLLCNQMGHSGSHVTQKYYIAISEDGIQELKSNLGNM